MKEPLFAVWVSNLPDQSDGYIRPIDFEEAAPGVYFVSDRSTTVDPAEAVLCTMLRWREVLDSSYARVSKVLSSDQLSEAEELIRDIRFVPASELGR